MCYMLYVLWLIYTLLGLGGFGPLCGFGVVSFNELISNPLLPKVLIADSRPPPTPLTSILISFTPIILAFSAASVGCLIYGTSPATNFCLVAASIDAVGQAVSTVASLFSGDYWSNFGTSDFTYCDKVEEEGLLD